MIALWMKANQVTLIDDEQVIAFRVSREQAIHEITKRGYSVVFAENTLDFGVSNIAWKQVFDMHTKTFLDMKIEAVEGELQRLKARRGAS